ncbi:MAG TPA: hypothetical protein VFI72_04435 [Candidatus Angelobacter sp.]|nr:hypothetical protein [Candidatus Angelobacter sp.]
MKTLLTLMRYFHYAVGITAPSKEHERLVLFVWISLAVGIIVLGVLFTLFIVPQVFRQ